MNFETINMGGYNLHLIKTNKFKTITRDVDVQRNIKKEEITERNLLKMVLLDSSNNYKTERDLIIESENLYDIKVSSSISRIGNFSNLSFQTKFLNEKYTEKDMNKESIIFFLDLIFNPYVKDNTFVSIDNQKNRLRQDILSIKDNKIRYSILKLMEKMKDKPYSYNTFGYLEDIDNITGKSLYEYYKKVLKEDKIDIFVLGDFCLSGKNKIIEIGKQLNGRKTLILGNHDSASIKTYYEAGFEAVSKYPIIIEDFFTGYKLRIAFSKKICYNALSECI